MNRFLAILILIVSMAACQPKGRVYVEHLQLSPNLEWLKKDVREFKVPIDENNLNYNLSLSFRYAYGYQFNVLKVMVTQISPSGNKTVTKYDLQIKNNKGDYIGEPGYDIWDSEHLIQSNIKFKEKGIYTYLLEHNMPTNPLNFAMEIGVVVDKIE